MLNQVAVEAIYSATYLENYLDSVENLPNDLQRNISRMRQLDVDFQGAPTVIISSIFSTNFYFFFFRVHIVTAILQDLEHYQELLQKGPDSFEAAADTQESSSMGGTGSGNSSASSNAGHWRKQLLQKVQSALIQSLEIGDEKVQIVQIMQDVVENKSRQLEANSKSLGMWIPIYYLKSSNSLQSFCTYSVKTT